MRVFPWLFSSSSSLSWEESTSDGSSPRASRASRSFFIYEIKDIGSGEMMRIWFICEGLGNEAYSAFACKNPP